MLQEAHAYKIECSKENVFAGNKGPHRQAKGVSKKGQAENKEAGPG